MFYVQPYTRRNDPIFHQYFFKSGGFNHQLVNPLVDVDRNSSDPKDLSSFSGGFHDGAPTVQKTTCQLDMQKKDGGKNTHTHTKHPSPGKLKNSYLRMSQEVRINGLVSGLFHLLINGVYLGYNPLILTIDPNFRPGTLDLNVQNSQKSGHFSEGEPIRIEKGSYTT